MEWEDDLRDYLMSLDKAKPVIYCGDLNVAHEEIDLKNPKTNRGNAGFSDQEREKMTALLSSGFTDTFRHLYPHQEGAYSWWSYRFNARKNNAGWRIDYFIVSDRLRDRILRAEILADIEGSDHCPVVLELTASTRARNRTAMRFFMGSPFLTGLSFMVYPFYIIRRHLTSPGENLTTLKNLRNTP